MGWSQTSRILLVWPVRGKILNRRLDLVFLHRHSSTLGAQLALVTRDRDVRFQARNLGIPIYTNVRKAEESHWRRPRHHERPKRLKLIDSESQDERIPLTDLREKQQNIHPSPPGWITHPITRFTIFLIGVIAILAIAALLVPNAEIELNPTIHQDSVTIPVLASPEIQSVNLSGEVPSSWFPVIVEGRETLPSSGTISIPNLFASGQVTFSNLTDQAIMIPEGTVVSTVSPDIIRFATTRRGNVPAGIDQRINLPIRAMNPGTEGNVKAESIIAIEGSLGLDLRVSNQNPTVGGSDRIAPAPTSEDFQELYNQLARSLRQTAMDEITKGLQTDDFLLPTTLSVENTLVETYNPPEIQPADQLELTLQMEFRAMVVSYEDLRALSLLVLEANRPKNHIYVKDTLEIIQDTAPMITNRQEVKWNIQARWMLQPIINETEVLNTVFGLPPNQAEARLSGKFDLASTARVNLHPEWWPRLPVLPFRITVSNIN
jgi:hypothetical protein